MIFCIQLILTFMMGSKEEPQNLTDRNEGLREIFLFSNGQQDSPPRKHCVCVNEPWDVTLKRISTAQRGSKHTIDLYTIGGKRIEGPLELADGAAYVAVEPPQTFVSAGYNDYLMKASRSREKRQRRIPERDFLTMPVKLDSTENLREESEEAIDTKIIQGAILLPTSVIVANEQNGITGEVSPDTLRNVKAIKRTSILKPTQNKRNSLSQQNSIITKNITNDNNVAPVHKKVRKTSKIDAIKKKFETPFTIGTENIIAPTKSNSIVTEIAGDETVNTRLASHNLEHTAPNYLQKETGMKSMKSPSNNNLRRLSAQHILTVNSSKTTSSAVIEQNILPETDNYINNHPDSEYIDPQNPSMAAVFDDSLLSRIRHAADYKEGCKTESNSNITTDVINEFSQTKTVLICSPTGAAEDNLTINVKHGNMVNLKLDIQFKYESNTVVETTHNYYENTRISIVNTPKSESPTQDIDVALAKNRQEAPILTEVELSFEPIHHIAKHLNAAGYQYHCCSSTRNTEPFVLVNVNNNDTGFILLPLRKRKENNERCNSELEINHHSKGKVQENHTLPRTKNNIVKSGDIDFIPDVSEQGNPIQSKSRPRDNTDHSDEIQIVPEVPEEGNFNQSKQNTRDYVQLDEITTVPDVFEKGYPIQNKPRTRDNTKQSEEIKIVPDLPDQGNSTQSRPTTRDNTVQSDDIKIVPEVPEQNNNLMYDLMPKDQSKRVSIVEENKTCNCCQTCTSQNQTTTCICGDIRLLTRPVYDNEQPVTSSSVLDHSTPVTNVSTFRDAFTQTVWSGTVLEARPREDGIYEFHMPTLETLKRYDAL